LPVRIYTLIANSTPSEVAALALLQAILVLLPLIVLSLFFRFEKGERGQ
jgi:ABC-type spermidine/putrescine transport system permease subunit II